MQPETSVLARPLRFGDLEQIAALRRLPRIGEAEPSQPEPRQATPRPRRRRASSPVRLVGWQWVNDGLADVTFEFQDGPRVHIRFSAEVTAEGPGAEGVASQVRPMVLRALEHWSQRWASTVVAAMKGDESDAD
ncbi:MAG: hypothetical protein AB1609_20620 [Bacillota bacterium]